MSEVTTWRQQVEIVVATVPRIMDAVIAGIGGLAATVFTFDLVVDLRRRFRPHVAAYAAGIAMFAAATWALVYALTMGWSGPAYRVFFLFGAILNIPVLALGSMFLVVGRKSGNAMALFCGALAAISITLVSTVPFAQPLPVDGIPSGIFPPISEGFGPRILAAVGGGAGAVILIVLALVSVFRFWKRNRRIVIGSALILAGVLVASLQGTLLALGESTGFALKLLVTSTLLWLGYRVTKGRRPEDATVPLVVLVGPSIESPERTHTELLISALESHGYRVMCPARDIEAWGDVGYTPAEVMHQTFQAVDGAALVLVDLHQGYGVVTAGYAAAHRIPVVVASPEGQRIPRPLRGVATMEVYYTAVSDIAQRLKSMVPTGQTKAPSTVRSAV